MGTIMEPCEHGTPPTQICELCKARAEDPNFVIECFMDGQWEIGIHDGNGNPVFYSTRKEAEDDIRDFVESSRAAHARGDLDSFEDYDEYRIKEVA